MRGRAAWTGNSTLWKALACLCVTGAVLLTLAVPGELKPSSSPSLKPFLNLVKEVSQFRRLNVLHPNPQSILDGHLLLRLSRRGQ